MSVKRKFSGPLHDRMVAKGFTVEKYAASLHVEPRSIVRMLLGQNRIAKQSRRYAGLCLGLSEKEFLELLEQQKVYGVAMERWRVFTRFATLVNLGLLEDVNALALLGISEDRLHDVRKWCDRLLAQKQQYKLRSRHETKKVKK